MLQQDSEGARSNITYLRSSHCRSAQAADAEKPSTTGEALAAPDATE